MLHVDKQRTDRRTGQPNGVNTVAALPNFAKAPDQLRTTKMSFFLNSILVLRPSTTRQFDIHSASTKF